MKDIIYYYYSILSEDIKKNNDYFLFTKNNISYILKPFYKNINYINEIYLLSNYLKLPFNKIIPNKFNILLSNINNQNYILESISNNKIKLSLNSLYSFETININNYNLDNLHRVNWENLWEEKIDYYEKQISENSKKYPLIKESINYFIGLTENAISYLVNTKMEEMKTIYDINTLSFDNIYKDLNDPTNIIIDHKGRLLGEYIKYSFFKDSKVTINDLNNYFNRSFYSRYGIRVLISRILYPSFYFNLYDEIIANKVPEKEINIVTDNIYDYQKYLKEIISYLIDKFNVPEIMWLKKRN